MRSDGEPVSGECVWSLDLVTNLGNIKTSDAIISINLEAVSPAHTLSLKVNSGYNVINSAGKQSKALQEKMV